MGKSTQKFTVVTDSKLIVSGSGANKPTVGTKLTLKLSVNADGSPKLADTQHPDGTVTIANKLVFSNSYPEYELYSFVKVEHYKAELADKLLQDEEGTMFIECTVIVPTFKPSGKVVKATLEV